jgi:hypothetical protein
LYASVASSAYHGPNLCVEPSVSSSGLRTIFGQSAAHYWAQSPYNPHAEPREETEAMILGRAAHHLLLGEADFAKHFVLRPDEIANEPWQGNKKICKAWLQARADEGLAVLKPEYRERIVGMRNGLAAHPMIDPNGTVRLLDGLVEHTIAWRDEDTGIWLKVRPDVIPTSSDEVADLKTIADITDDGIEKAIGKTDLQMQGALVGMAWRAVLGREMASFSLVFIESKAPYVCRVATLKPHDLELGEQQVRAALQIFKRGLQSGRWPGPGGEQHDAAYVELKPFHRSRIENRLSVIKQELAA